MEVNMAVFVMSVGVLSMVILYPLGLRESIQGQADLKQTMLAEYLLNQAVGIASQPDVTWNEWMQFDSVGLDQFPSFIDSKIKVPSWTDAPTIQNNRCRVLCGFVPGSSCRIAGIMVQSTDLVEMDDYNSYSNNPIFYAEVTFQGVNP